MPAELIWLVCDFAAKSTLPIGIVATGKQVPTVISTRMTMQP